jgi:hypothetical protein
MIFKGLGFRVYLYRAKFDMVIAPLLDCLHIQVKLERFVYGCGCTLRLNNVYLLQQLWSSAASGERGTHRFLPGESGRLVLGHALRHGTGKLTILSPAYKNTLRLQLKCI